MGLVYVWVYRTDLLGGV